MLAYIAKLARARDDAGHRAGHGRDQNVPVVDVGEFVPEHGTQFAFVQDLHDAAGHAYRGMPRATTGGKRVRGVRGADVQPGHRLVRRRGEFAHDPVDRRCLDLGDGLGAHRSKRQLVAVEVHVGIHADGKQNGSPQKERAVEQRADEDDQRRHPHQQAECLRTVRVAVQTAHLLPRWSRRLTRTPRCMHRFCSVNEGQGHQGSHPVTVGVSTR